jgi:hypothetical protein
MPINKRTLILIGLEGPELVDPITNKLFWHPMATDAHWRSLVMRAIVEFLSRAQGEWRWSANGAVQVVFRNADDLARALGKNRYDRVVIYSHGDRWALMPILTTPRSYVRDYALAKALAASGVKSVLLLGCRSKGLAQTIARISENVVRIGGIEPERDDYADRKRLDILNTIVWGYGGRR